jgi:hypothetical protein
MKALENKMLLLIKKALTVFGGAELCVGQFFYQRYFTATMKAAHKSGLFLLISLFKTTRSEKIQVKAPSLLR